MPRHSIIASRSIRKSFIKFLAVISTFICFTTATAQAEYLTFNGSGWGSGIGLSQYGAKAMGSDGATYRQILSHYFPTTDLLPSSSTKSRSYLLEEPMPLWVGLLQDAHNVAFKLQDRSELCFDESGLCFLGEQGTNWRFISDTPETCVFVNENESNFFTSVSRSCNASVTPIDSNAGVEVPVKARTYKNGILRFREFPQGDTFHVVFQTDIENYLNGVSILPDSWPEASLQAQVVALRSKTLYSLTQNGFAVDFTESRKTECYCNIRDLEEGQVFRGWTGEIGHPNWVSAVQSTKGLVLSFEGDPVLAMSSSSSGGSTESYVDVFPKGGHPYLISVDDSAAFSDTAANPHMSWSARYNQSVLANTYGFSWLSNISLFAHNESGSANSLQLNGIIAGRPSSKIVSAKEIRSLLSLRSTTFEVEMEQIFEDVNTVHPFAGEILGLFLLDVTKGCSSQNFCPEQLVSRGQMAAFLSRALELNYPEDIDSFIDDNDSPFEKDIEALKAASITSGCSANSFCPERPVTRAEMAAFLVRAIDGF